LDETDSGLDVDAVRLASQSIAKIGGHEMGILIITHHEQLLEYNRPNFTHVMLGGRIVETGGPELADELHKQGYDRIRRFASRCSGRRSRAPGNGGLQRRLTRFADEDHAFIARLGWELARKNSFQGV